MHTFTGATLVTLSLLVALPAISFGDDGRAPDSRPGAPPTTQAERSESGSGSDTDGGGAVTNDQVVADDLIVNGSACVGIDCANGEPFGFATIVLKENNTRLVAIDTSTGTFPTTDWQLEFNASASGGGGYFAVRDCGVTSDMSSNCGGTMVFGIEAGAGSNSIHVDSSGNLGGNVGFGTSAPVLDLHAASGNTPGLRLDQTGSSGFTPQAWDVAGNEANFFVRDVTGGSALPFRIEPGAASNTLVLDSADRVGVGTNAPLTALHVRGTDPATNALNTTAVTVENASASSGRRFLLELKNFGNVGYRLVNSSTAATWTITNQRGRLEMNGGSGYAFSFRANGDLVIDGDLTANGTLYASDAARKAGFAAVDTSTVLGGVRSLTIGTWSWVDGDGTVHMGPTAQDFAAAFGLGGTDTAINAADVNGVTLAAIQALAEENEALALQNESLAAQNRALEERLAALEAVVADLLSGH